MADTRSIPLNYCPRAALLVVGVPRQGISRQFPYPPPSPVSCPYALSFFCFLSRTTNISPLPMFFPSALHAHTFFVFGLKDNPLAEERVRLREELRASDPLESTSRGNEDDDCGAGLGWLEGGASGDVGQGDY